MTAVPATEQTGEIAVATTPRRWTATFALAGIVAAIACAVPLAAAFLLISSHSAGLFFGYGAYADFMVVGSLLFAVAGLAAAVAIAIVAARSRSRAPIAAGRAPVHERSRRAALLWVAAGVAACSAVVLVLIWGTGFGQSERDLMLYAAQFAALVGLVVAGVLAARAVWPGRPTSLRTRAFFVIVVAMVVPCLVLSVLGVSAYLLSWDTAGTLYWDQAAYGARALEGDVGSLRKVPGGLAAAAEARLSREIVSAFANDNRNGALRSTMSAVRTEHVLPPWAIRSLERRGYAIGTKNGDAATSGSSPDVVAWRVGRQDVRYFRSDYRNGPGTVDAPLPQELLGSLASAAVAGIILVLALGLLGAWLLSRGVVRPVRRLAEASGRLAEGAAGVTVKPEGPRELRELAMSFNDMNAKLTKAQETEQAFLLSVSHELKTPLTSIRGYAEGIGDGTVKPDDGADVIGAESSRLERLVGDLLESGRMRKAAFAVRSEAVDLATVAEDVVLRYEATARDAGLTLLVDTEAGGGAVADHDRVLQVVSNLVENAIRCTPAPGAVTITTAPGTITVADTGRGLTSDDLPRAFERFYLYSRYGTDRPVGTGLGLAIVKELTEAMGGAVSVSSAVGVGTAFTVALPPDDSTTAAETAGSAEVIAPIAAEPTATTAVLKDDES